MNRTIIFCVKSDKHWKNKIILLKSFDKRFFKIKIYILILHFQCLSIHRPWYISLAYVTDLYAFKFCNFVNFYRNIGCFTLRSVLQKPLRSSPIIPRLVHLLNRNNSVLTGQIFTKLDIDVVLIKHRYRKNSSTESNLDHGRIVLQGIFHVPFV